MIPGSVKDWFSRCRWSRSASASTMKSPPSSVEICSRHVNPAPQHKPVTSTHTHASSLVTVTAGGYRSSQPAYTHLLYDTQRFPFCYTCH